MDEHKSGPPEAVKDFFKQWGFYPMGGGEDVTTEEKDKKAAAVVDPNALKEKPSMEILLKMVHDLRKEVQDGHKNRENLDNRLKDIVDTQSKLQLSGSFGGNAIFQTKDADIERMNYAMKMGGGYEVKTVNELILLETKDPFIRYIQEQSDLLYIANVVGKRIDHNFNIKTWKLYKKFCHELGFWNKALATSITTGGTEWVPTNFSSSLIELVRLELKVAALHARIPMPTKQYTLPVEGSDMFAYLVSESISDVSTAIKTSTPRTTSVTFTAQKLATRVLTSTELDEDSIIGILPWLRMRIVHALASAEEYAIINGDTAGIRDNTDQAAEVINPMSSIRAWNGYRTVAAQIGKGVTIDAAGAFLTNGLHLLRVQASMGKYGIDPKNLVWVTSPRGYNMMMRMNRVQTLDTFGPNAVLLNGQLGSIFGMPIVVSEWVRQDLNGSGVSGGATSVNVDTIILGVHRQCFAIGDRRKLTLKTEEKIETDQIMLVATERLDFKPLYPTSQTFVGGVYDLE